MTPTQGSMYLQLHRLMDDLLQDDPGQMPRRQPVALGPGHWYLGVYNNMFPATNVNYTIVVTHLTNAVPFIIDLFNGIPYTNYNVGIAPFNIDYYHYAVSTNAVWTALHRRPASLRPIQHDPSGLRIPRQPYFACRHRQRAMLGRIGGEPQCQHSAFGELRPDPARRLDPH